MTRRARSSSVSSSRSPSPADRRGSNNVAKEIPQLGAIVKGIVSRVTQFGAFVKVPGYIDGLIHVSRIAESGSVDAKDYFGDTKTVFARVVVVGDDRYGLDMRFVDQKNGVDMDPENERRLALEPGLASGKPTERVRANANTAIVLPEENTVYDARIEKSTNYGFFVHIDSVGFKLGLLPIAKVVGSVAIGDAVKVKVVEVLRREEKFNCDMRFVDQESGADLDPEHAHSREKIGGPKDGGNSWRDQRRSGENGGGRRRSRSRDGVARSRRSPSPDARGYRERAAVSRGNGGKRDRSEEVIRRPRERSVDRRRTTGRDRSEEVIRRRPTRERSEEIVRRPSNRDRMEDVIKQRNNRDRSEEVDRRRGTRDRSDERRRSTRDRSEEIVRRR